MSCYHPITVWKGERLESGKHAIVFSPHLEKVGGSEMQIPCGQCVGCRLERSRQWAMRCVHEASLYKKNCFLTLTYDENTVPDDGSLQLEHFQNFMKRLRKAFSSEKIRYFMCGEYGERNKRPHYHACLFGFDFSDKAFWSQRDNIRLYTSEKLNKIWGYGYCVIGDVTFDSAAYVARYIMKKVTGDQADAHYQGLKPEFTTMSRRPGVGRAWYQKYKSDIFPGDFAVMRGKEVKPPKFYTSIYEVEEPEAYAEIKQRRLKSIKHVYPKHKRLMGYPLDVVDNTIDRLLVKEKIKKETIKQSLSRNYENGGIK